MVYSRMSFYFYPANGRARGEIQGNQVYKFTATALNMSVLPIILYKDNPSNSVVLSNQGFSVQLRMHKGQFHFPEIFVSKSPLYLTSDSSREAVNPLRRD